MPRAPAPRRCLAPSLALALLTLGTTAAAHAAADASAPVIETAALAERLARVLVVDVRPEADYRTGHVPSALWLRWTELDPVRRKPEELAAALGRAGISADQEVVVVGAGPSAYGEEGRVVWLLDWLGQRRVALLSGGFAKWKREGRLVEQGPGALRAPTTYRVRLRNDRRISAIQVERLRRAPGVAVLDVRTADEYAGKHAYGAPRAGRIPGARHLHWKAFFTPSGELDRSPAMEARLRALGIGPSTPVIVYCHSGVRAGLAVTALRALGRTRVYHYDASWEDWSRRPDLPVER